MRLAVDGAHKGERALMIAARDVAKPDAGGRRVVGDHTPEQIARNSADEARRDAKPRHADSDIEA